MMMRMTLTTRRMSAGSAFIAVQPISAELRQRRFDGIVCSSHLVDRIININYSSGTHSTWGEFVPQHCGTLWNHSETVIMSECDKNSKTVTIYFSVYRYGLKSNKFVSS
jgi:hypothetical protein